LLVSGQNQQVAGITGAGDTVVSAGASLIADSIVQNAFSHAAQEQILAASRSHLRMRTARRVAHVVETHQLVAPGSFGSALPGGSALAALQLFQRPAGRLVAWRRDSVGSSPSGASGLAIRLSFPSRQLFSLLLVAVEPLASGALAKPSIRARLGE